MFAQSLFESSPYRGIRRVIDVSGDGANNDGPLVTLIRDEVLAKGITINGLPIMLNRPNLMNVNVERRPASAARTARFLAGPATGAHQEQRRADHQGRDRASLGRRRGGDDADRPR